MRNFGVAFSIYGCRFLGLVGRYRWNRKVGRGGKTKSHYRWRKWQFEGHILDGQPSISISPDIVPYMMYFILVTSIQYVERTCLESWWHSLLARIIHWPNTQVYVVDSLSQKLSTRWKSCFLYACLLVSRPYRFLLQRRYRARRPSYSSVLPAADFCFLRFADLKIPEHSSSAGFVSDPLDIPTELSSRISQTNPRAKSKCLTPIRISLSTMWVATSFDTLV